MWLIPWKVKKIRTGRKKKKNIQKTFIVANLAIHFDNIKREPSGKCYFISLRLALSIGYFMPISFLHHKYFFQRRHRNLGFRSFRNFFDTSVHETPGNPLKDKIMYTATSKTILVMHETPKIPHIDVLYIMFQNNKSSLTYFRDWSVWGEIRQDRCNFFYRLNK